MSSDINVSVILVNYNTAQLTLNAIKSVYKLTSELKFEIILVDNCSSDNSIELINQNFPEVIIIKNKKNIGFGKANNKGFEVAKGKYYFLLNTDTYLLNNAIKILYDFMENPYNQNVGVVGAKLFKPNGEYCVSDGRFPNYKLFVKGSFLKYFYNKDYYSNEQFEPIFKSDKTTYETDYVSGADFFVRRDIIEKVGGFDNRFFLYAEETELCYRIKKMIPSTKCVVNPQAKIVHIGQGSISNKLVNKKKRLRFINGTTIYYRITEGNFQSLMYYLVSIKRLYLNKLFNGN